MILHFAGVRRTAAAGVATVLCGVVAAWVGVSPAVGAPSKITSQPYLSVVGMADIRKQHLDGAGVTIGVIDSGVPDLSVPELAGADVTVRNPCKVGRAPDDVAHTTAVLSILASKDYGWAPKAKYLVYVQPLAQKEKDACDKAAKGPSWVDYSYPSDEGAAVQRALNDNVDVITMSLGVGAGPGLLYTQSWEYAVARAVAHGVPVVVGSGNDHASSISRWGATIGVVAVGAGDLTGKRAGFSNYGPGLTIMAPGTDITMRDPGRSGKLTVIDTGQTGTSFATPMVAGLLALGMQKWPDADGNQLVASLIGTAHHSGSGWSNQYGWGNFSQASFLGNDPSEYRHENPLLDKISGSNADLQRQEFLDYWDGVADPTVSIFPQGDDEYVYRGSDEAVLARLPADKKAPGTSPRFMTASPSPSSSTRPSSEGSSPSPMGSVSPGPAVGPASPSTWWLWLVAAGAVVTVATVVVITVTSRSHRRASMASKMIDASPGEGFVEFPGGDAEGGGA